MVQGLDLPQSYCHTTSGYLLASHGLFLDFLVLSRVINLFPRSREAASVYLMPFDGDDEHLVPLLRNQDTTDSTGTASSCCARPSSVYRSPLDTDRSCTASVASHIRKFASRTLEKITQKGGTRGRPAIMSWPPATHESSSSWASAMMITHRHDYSAGALLPA